MSTRVQKGGPIFKPVAKPRARLGSEVRHASAAPPEARASIRPSTYPSHPRSESAHVSAPSADDSCSMPPPSTIPQRATPAPPNHPLVLASWDTPEKPPESSRFTIATPTRTSVRPPPVQRSPSQPQAVEHLPTRVSVTPGPSAEATRPPAPITTPSRDVPSAPPVIASRSTSVAPPPAPILQAAVLPHAPQSQFSEAVSDSQIDPALIQAVVTALRHVDQAQAEVTAPPEFEASSSIEFYTVTEKELPTDEMRGVAAPGKEKRTRPKRSVQQTEESFATAQDAAEAPESEAAEGEQHQLDAQAAKKRKRNPNVTPRKRRSRAPSQAPYDPSADPGEEIDPTAVTMAELCEDTGRGRVSSKAAVIMNNHAAWRAANREKRAHMRAKMEAKKYGRNPDEEENIQNAPASSGPGTMKVAASTNATPGPSGVGAMTRAHSREPEGHRGDDFDYTQAMSTSRYNVQVRIGPNGETIIDEASLFVDRHEEEDATVYTHIEESDATKFVNSATYSKKMRGSRWSGEETELFYDALSQFGENYELISLVLPGRDRKACKNKFKAEDKRNSARITYCLKNRRPYDIATLSRMTGKDFSGPTPEIRAPTPLRMPETPHNESVVLPPAEVKPKEQSQPPAVEQGAEIIGIIDDPPNQSEVEPI